MLNTSQILNNYNFIDVLKLQPHEDDNLDERIVTIPCKRVYGATQARPCETSGCSRLFVYSESVQ